MKFWGKYEVRHGISQTDGRRLLTLFLVVLTTCTTSTEGGAFSSPSLHTCLGQNAVVSGDEVRTLNPAETLTRHMRAGDKHIYRLALAERQFARLFVEQRGVDIGVKVFAPGGSLLIDMDSPNGFYGLEAVSVMTQAAGSYAVEVYSDSAYPPGDYELKVEGPRAASESDEKHVMAERHLHGGAGAEGQGAKSSRGRGCRDVRRGG